MKQVDYIVVGGGFAGLFFVHQLIKNKNSFLLISDRLHSASEVSGGVVNPIVLNKFTSFWLGKEQLSFLNITLSEMKIYLGKDYFEYSPVHRIIHNENEKQTWLKKSDLTEMSGFLSKEFLNFPTINNSFGVGVVKQSGRLAVHSFFSDFYTFLQNSHLHLSETFDFNSLDAEKKMYKDISYKNIVFAEGFRVKENPFFSNLPIIPVKGHHLTVNLSIPVPENAIYKKQHFLFRLENGFYYSGGTFDWDSVDYTISEDSVSILKKSIEEIYAHPFTIVDTEVGIRATLNDRRPTLGEHSKYKGLFVLNGMGTRGVLNGCYFANELYQFIENNVPLHPEMDIQRFHNSND
jgi:glycine/D-amino acid oxidase-like deaminating enzyme